MSARDSTSDTCEKKGEAKIDDYSLNANRIFHRDNARESAATAYGQLGPTTRGTVRLVECEPSPTNRPSFTGVSRGMILVRSGGKSEGGCIRQSLRLTSRIEEVNRDAGDLPGLVLQLPMLSASSFAFADRR